MFGKNRNIVVGIYLVGSNKTFTNSKLALTLKNDKLYKDYVDVLFDKMDQINTDDNCLLACIDDEVVKKLIDINKGTTGLTRGREIARQELSKSFRGFGDDLVDTLAATIIHIYTSVKNKMMSDKTLGCVSLAIKVPKYVTMILDSDSEKHNSINWLIDNNSLVSNIHDVLGATAYECGFKGDVLTVLRWQDL